MKKFELTADELNMIQTLRRQKAQQGAEDTHSNEGGNTNGKTKDEKPKRTYKMQSVYKVLGKAKRLFLKQVTKDINAKTACMKMALASYDDLYPDALRFELDFRSERERLTDSKKFCDACRALGKEPNYVADNTVFEGKTMLERVLKEGIQALGEKINMFNAPLWEDTQKLYAGSAFEQGEKKEGANA